MIFVLIHNLKPVMNLATTVIRAKDGFAEFYWFYLNGLGFKLYLGKDIPKDIRQLCAYRSVEGFVMMDREFGQMVRQFSKDFLTSNNISEKLQRTLRRDPILKKDVATEKCYVELRDGRDSNRRRAS